MCAKVKLMWIFIFKSTILGIFLFLQCKTILSYWFSLGVLFMCYSWVQIKHFLLFEYIVYIDCFGDPFRNSFKKLRKLWKVMSCLYFFFVFFILPKIFKFNIYRIKYTKGYQNNTVGLCESFKIFALTVKSLFCF